MFLRLRWFVMGVLGAVGAMSYLAVQVKRAREKLSAGSMARSGGRSVASLLDRAADRVDPGTPRHPDVVGGNETAADGA